MLADQEVVLVGDADQQGPLDPALVEGERRLLQGRVELAGSRIRRQKCGPWTSKLEETWKAGMLERQRNVSSGLTAS